MNSLIRTITTICFIGILTACEDQATEPGYITEAIIEDHSDIADPFSRWQAYDLSSYVIEQRVICFCPYVTDTCDVYVRNNSVLDVIKNSDGSSIFTQVPHHYKTVDELFDLTRSINPDSVASVEIQYDQRFGFPTVISLDYNAQAVDDEITYWSHGIQRLLP